jgi:hypothetical protein
MKQMKKISKKDFENLEACYKNAKSHHSAEELEAEYACLKVLFAILETNCFKYIDFDTVSFMNHFENEEIELICNKFSTHKIVKNHEFATKFKISPYAFLDFLHINGAINERATQNKNRPVGQYIKDEKVIVVPKVGDYFLCSFTGFWKKATRADVEFIEKARKESLYMHFEADPDSESEV